MTQPSSWLQYNLDVPKPGPQLYRALACHADELLSDGVVENVFYMHKPPGIRFRCLAPAATRPDVDARCRRLLTGLAGWPLIRDWRNAVYEPEERLFGGAVSMRSVHRVFTADSLAWLGFHAATPPGGPTSASRWAMSLQMIRWLLASVQVVGWEDIDVWDRVGRYGGRVLAPQVGTDERTRRIAQLVRRGWADPAELRPFLPAMAGDLLSRYEQAVRATGERWLAEYFTGPDARTGPRQAAAFMVIFHWNRGRLPIHHQALIADLLASRQEDD